MFALRPLRTGRIAGHSVHRISNTEISIIFSEFKASYLASKWLANGFEKLGRSSSAAAWREVKVDGLEKVRISDAYQYEIKVRGLVLNPDFKLAGFDPMSYGTGYTGGYTRENRLSSRASPRSSTSEQEESSSFFKTITSAFDL